MRYGPGSSWERLRTLAKRHGINPKTVAEWKGRDTIAGRPTGPRELRSTVLSPDEEAIIVAFRRHTLLPLDDCLYALQPSIPGLARSSLHCCLHRQGISRLPDLEGDKPGEDSHRCLTDRWRSRSPQGLGPGETLLQTIADRQDRTRL
jgi:hypothetical protein